MPQIVLTVSEEQAKMFAAAQRRGIEPRLVFSPPSVIPERPAHRVTPEPQMAQHADLYTWHKDPDGGHGVTPERPPAEEVRRRLKASR